MAEREGTTWRTAAAAGVILVLPASLALVSGARAAAPAVSPSASPSQPRTAPVAPVDFNRDVRPLLSENCFTCHGPDANQRQGNLRLDLREGALADLGGRRAVVPGQPARSELLRRLLTHDADLRMPPAATGKRLTTAQVETLRRWIAQGAKWQQHWSLIPPVRPPLPAVKQKSWPRNALDTFVLARLEREGLKPSPEADRATLIRRVSLDLTGIPPTPREVDAFLADRSPDAYEKVVGRLLASPRFGERMAARWLDAARYADTNGYQSDGERHMWRWRDWVIDAYNQDMPYDRFTVEQIAGDLLPNATLEQKIASGFNRNHRGNGEGGIIPEEYLVEYAVDRVETTSTVFLGLTMGCARCHDHKYDPLTQRDFYRFYAYFNNIPERGRANKFGNSPPMIPAPTREQQAGLTRLEQRLARAEQQFQELSSQRTAQQQAWERTLAGAEILDWSPTDELECRFGLDGDARPEGIPPQRGPLQPRFVDGEAVFGPGRVGRAPQFDGRRFVEAGNLGDFGFYDRFTLAAWFRADDAQGGTILSRMTDTARADGYSVVLKDGRIQVNLVKRWLDDALRLETETAVRPGEWHHVAVTYDGTRVGTGVKVYLDGVPVKTRLLLDELNQSFNNQEPLRIGAGGGPNGRFRGQIDEVHVYRRVLDPEEAAMLAVPETVTAITTVPARMRNPSQVAKIANCYLERYAPEPLRKNREEVIRLRKERARMIDSFPTVMVMEEKPVPAETFVLIRGQYDRPGEKVTRGVPASLPPLPGAGRNDRLALARWLVSPNHPLTARVAVNRTWQMLFGAGLVKTAEDFGSQGALPSHPELLDYLAVRFAGGAVEDKPATVTQAQGGKGAGRRGEGEAVAQNRYGLAARKDPGEKGGRGNRNLRTAAASDPRGSHYRVPTGRRNTQYTADSRSSFILHPSSFRTGPRSPAPNPGEGLGWSTKALLRLIVTSATYRQSSRVTPDLLERDPENRLLARGPRFRLPAEMVRDQALTASGLLVEKVGGPSVKPYQPPGIWKDLAGGEDYQPGTGDDLYRRSLYTFWKRTAPPPALTAFDAAGRETCVVRESRTNTPLQALNLMNDVTYVEAARALAQQVLREGPATAEERLSRVFRRVLVRRPRPDERRVLREAFEAQLSRFRSDRKAAAALVAVGESRADPRLDPAELAAYTTVASLVFNLDEAVTKE